MKNSQDVFRDQVRTTVRTVIGADANEVWVDEICSLRASGEQWPCDLAEAVALASTKVTGDVTIANALRYAWGVVLESEAAARAVLARG